MSYFFGINAGEEKSAPGIRITSRPDGSAVWMHGKWLELGDDHAVIFVDGRAEFQRPDGRVLHMGDFPGWVVRGTGKKPIMAMMFNVGQFIGGEIRIIPTKGEKLIYKL